MLPDTFRARTWRSMLGFQDVAVPSSRSISAIWLRLCPPILVKLPPTYSLLLFGDSTRTRTSKLALESQDVARPVLASRAAIWLRTCPPQVGTFGSAGGTFCWNAPPTYTFPLPGTTMARTGPLQSGAHEVGSPVLMFTAAIFLWVCPPTELKLPAIYSVLPDMNMARTTALSLGWGSQVVSTVLSALIWASPLRATVPTWSNCPPIYHPFAPSGNTTETLPLTRGKSLSSSPVFTLRATPCPV